MRAGVLKVWLAVLGIALALPAMAQTMGLPVQGGPMGSQGPGMMGQGAMPGPRAGRGGAWSSHEGPLITIMLEQKQELGLTLDQERKLRDLRTEFAKESERRSADIRVAEIELDSLLEQDRWDLAKIEPKVKQIATLQGDLRLARIKTLGAGLEVLTPEQLEKLKQIGHRMRPGSGPGGYGPGMMGPGPGGPRGPRQ
ncbi:MAG: Spy/CpxP family protein refolding chaperone [Candidatus Methylomirabilales bacterium]